MNLHKLLIVPLVAEDHVPRLAAFPMLVLFTPLDDIEHQMFWITQVSGHSQTLTIVEDQSGSSTGSHIVFNQYEDPMISTEMDPNMYKAMAGGY